MTRSRGALRVSGRQLAEAAIAGGATVTTANGITTITPAPRLVFRVVRILDPLKISRELWSRTG